MSTKKITNLDQLRLLAERTKTEITELDTKIQEIVTVGGQPNVIESVKVNGSPLTPDENKAVDITMPTKVSDLENDAKYQKDTEVAAAIQSAISSTGHAHFEKADTIPTAETAEENVLYLVMNSKSKHYDIYALVSGEVVLIDDTTVDLSAYSTTEQMNTAITEAVDALKNGDVAGAVERIAALEAVGATKVEESDTNGNIKINGTETVVYTLPDTVLQDANIASDEEVNAMLLEVFGE